MVRRTVGFHPIDRSEHLLEHGGIRAVAQENGERMKTSPHAIEDGDILLGPSWVLTANHKGDCRGQPVLVYLPTREAFGPGDVVAPGDGSYQPARMFVQRLARTLRDEGKRQTALDW